jgi:hypothetical protein
VCTFSVVSRMLSFTVPVQASVSTLYAPAVVALSDIKVPQIIDLMSSPLRF